MFRNRFGCLPAIYALLIATTEAQASRKPSEAELDAITARGVLLTEYDRAAWQATDAVRATHPNNDVGYYIAQKTDEGWRVDFGRLNEAQKRFLVDYEAVRIGPSERYEISTFHPAKEETGWNFAAAKGIVIAMRNFGKTNRPYNVAVLPAEHEGMYVYLYPAQVSVGAYPLGADVRYWVTSDGGKIIEKHPMHRTIIESIPSRSDMTVKAGYHTHVLSHMPEDTDVMLVLTREPRIPEIVIAGPYMFTIAVNGKISVEDRPKPKEHTQSGTVGPKDCQFSSAYLARAR